MKLFLDDERPCPPGWIPCRWPHEVIELLKIGDVTHVSLDHDLGDLEDAIREGRQERTGYDVILWIEEQVALRGFAPPALTVHSAKHGQAGRDGSWHSLDSATCPSGRPRRVAGGLPFPSVWLMYLGVAYARYWSHIAYATRWCAKLRRPDMPTEAPLPGIAAAQNVLGLTLDEIASALKANPSTVYRWREGGTPNAVSMEGLMRLEELADEIRHALGQEDVRDWMEKPSRVLGGKSPREMILSGRSETVLGALMAQNYMLRALEAEEPESSVLVQLISRTDLPVAKRAALSIVEQHVDEMFAKMQNPEDEAAAARAFAKRPRVRIRKRASSQATEG